jgi:transposase
MRRDGLSTRRFTLVGRLKPTVRRVHTVGELLLVDFAGHTMEVVDGATGEMRAAEVFVAVLGASTYLYAEATWTRALPDWIAAHVNALTALGGAHSGSSAII